MMRQDLEPLNCIGYTPAMKQAVHATVQHPVLLASEMLAEVAKELLGGPFGDAS